MPAPYFDVSGDTPIVITQEIEQAAVNALDHVLDPADKLSVINRTGIFDCRHALNNAVRDAIRHDKPLYIPAGLWIIRADTGNPGQFGNDTTSQFSGWRIDLEPNRGLLVFGDGDLTVLRRQATWKMEKRTSIAWYIPATGAAIAFHKLHFDGNEQACPIAEEVPVTPAMADGLNRVFSFNIPSFVPDAGRGAFGLTLTTNGHERMASHREKITSFPQPSMHSSSFFEPPERGTIIRGYNLWAFEHGANLQAHSVDNPVPRLAAIVLDHVSMSNCVADGLRLTTSSDVTVVRHFRSQGRTRRPRLDIHLGSIAPKTLISDFVGDFFGSEDALWPIGTAVELEDVTIRTNFYFSGKQLMTINGNNLTYGGELGNGAPGGSFGTARGTIRNSRFVRWRALRNSELRFEGCVFVVGPTPGSPGEGHALPVSVDGPAIREPVQFVACHFMAVDGLTHGNYVTVDGLRGLSEGTAPDNRPVVVFTNCTTETALDHFCKLDNRCKVILSGGKLAATRAIVHVLRNHDVSVSDPSQWSGSVFEFGRGAIASDVIYPARIEMSGKINPLIVEPSFNRVIGYNEPQQSDKITWVGGFEGTIPVDPNGRVHGLPGLELTQGALVWRYKNLDADGQPLPIPVAGATTFYQ